LRKLDAYAYYFQFTLTPYGPELEPNVADKDTSIVPTFIELSKMIGSDRVIWRYDSIVITSKWTLDRHIAEFTRLSDKLAGYTKKVII